MNGKIGHIKNMPYHKNLRPTDDRSFIIENHNETKFKLNTNEIFNEKNKWFHSNLLMLNCDKTYFLQFLIKTGYEINLQVLFSNRKISTAQI
jgi:hypothetical protein